jgi:hypothetical protein
MVAAQRTTRLDEYKRHIQALNASFAEWFQNEVTEAPSAALVDGVQDYIEHVAQLEGTNMYKAYRADARFPG